MDHAQYLTIIIQQIVTMPIYGKEALNICHLYMTDILRYT